MVDPVSCFTGIVCSPKATQINISYLDRWWLRGVALSNKNKQRKHTGQDYLGKAERLPCSPTLFRAQTTNLGIIPAIIPH